MPFCLVPGVFDAVDMALVRFPLDKGLAVVYTAVMKAGNVQYVVAREAIGVNKMLRAGLEERKRLSKQFRKRAHRRPHRKRGLLSGPSRAGEDQKKDPAPLRQKKAQNLHRSKAPRHDPGGYPHRHPGPRGGRQTPLGHRPFYPPLPGRGAHPGHGPPGRRLPGLPGNQTPFPVKALQVDGGSEFMAE